jgi:uncharacterized membrane protein HdeD (DUF308 family)
MTQQSSQVDIDSALEAARAQIKQNWGWFLALGIVFMLAGIAAIAFLAGGVLMIVHSFSSARWQGFLLGLLIGILYLVAGGWLAFFPLTGIITLTILLAALFLAEGVLEVIMAFRVRPHEGWGWLLLSGLVAVAVGVMIGMNLPSSATWAIGLLTGVNLLSTGVSFIVLALAGRRGSVPAMA